MNKPLLISCSGFAKSGKSTFCKLVSDELKSRFNINCFQLSFARQLRLDIEEFLSKCGFNIWEDKEKDEFRPVLLWYGRIMRKKTGGQYFIDKVKKEIESIQNHLPFNQQKQVCCLGDLRYKEFEYDEIDYCLSMGPVVHISRYKLALGTGSEESNNLIKHFDLPPNEFEAKNDPLIKERADYRLEWKNENGQVENLKPYITHFVNWLEQNYLSENNHLS